MDSSHTQDILYGTHAMERIHITADRNVCLVLKTCTCDLMFCPVDCINSCDFTQDLWSFICSTSLFHKPRVRALTHHSTRASRTAWPSHESIEEGQCYKVASWSGSIHCNQLKQISVIMFEPSTGKQSLRLIALNIAETLLVLFAPPRKG